MNKNLEKLLKINMWISKYLVFSLPVVIGLLLWAVVMGEGTEWHGDGSLLWEILACHFLIWLVVLIYFMMSLVFWRAFRERILTILTFSKERDERESYISGRASKATFYSTLAVLILFFFFSGLHVHIYKRPKEEVGPDDKRGTISVGFKFEFVKSASATSEGTAGSGEDVFVMNGIPLTQESIFLFLIFYHVTSYHIFTRRRLEDV